MKKLLILTSLIFCSPTFAQTQSYRPFTYETPCALKNKDEFIIDTCKVVETREKGGALRTRNIFSNGLKLTIKGWFDKEKGYIQTDSHNKFTYKWEYKVGEVDGPSAWTMIMPGVLLKEVSWD